MKKLIIPVTLLVACSLIACGGNSSSSSSSSTSTSSSSPAKAKTLKEFVAALSDGEHSEEEIEGIYADETISSSDNDVKYASVQQLDYTPLWALSEGLEEEVYEESVHKLNVTETYKRYDNNVIVTNTNYSCYDYDTENPEDPEEGISKTERAYKDVSHIYFDGDDTRYTYTRNKDAENAYSFSHAVPTNDNLTNYFVSGGGMSTFLVECKAAYEETYAYYKEAWGEEMEAEEVFSAYKEGDKLEVSCVGKLKMALYSAERVWGYEDYEEEVPTKKVHSGFEGKYVDRSIKFQFKYTINNGFIEDASLYEFTYCTIMYQDRNWEDGDPLPAYELSDEYIEGLDLYIPDKFTYDGKEIDNPYRGTGYDDYLPYGIYNFSTSGDSLGDFNIDNIPDKTLYRDSDMTDVGGWFDVKDMDEYVE